MRFAFVFLAGALVAAAPGAPAQPSPASLPKLCSGCNLAGAKLEDADLSHGIYVGTNFESADLRNASFRNTKLIGANFLDTDLRGAAFDGADCTACNFIGAKLDGATFTGAQMVAANFGGFNAKVDNAQLRALLAGCVLCNFSKSNLSGHDLSQLPLIQTNLSQADLRGANLDGAILCTYVLNEAQRQVSCDNLQGAQTAGAGLRDVRICENALTQSGCTAVDPQTLQRSQPTPEPAESPD